MFNDTHEKGNFAWFAFVSSATLGLLSLYPYRNNLGSIINVNEESCGTFGCGEWPELSQRLSLRVLLQFSLQFRNFSNVGVSTLDIDNSLTMSPHWTDGITERQITSFLREHSHSYYNKTMPFCMIRWCTSEELCTRRTSGIFNKPTS